MQLTSLELQYVSPKLLMCRDLELAVPGTYEPHKPVIHIRHVHASLNVITSKQRPRKLFITGKVIKNIVWRKVLWKKLKNVRDPSFMLIFVL